MATKWTYGIPSYDLAQHFVYFLDLQETTGTPVVARQKQQLLDGVYEDIDKAQQQLNAFLEDINVLKQTGDLLHQIAENERQKELLVITDYYRQLNKEFPNLKDIGLTEQLFKEDPETYYVKLIEEINKAKQRSENYKIELERIKRNITSETRKEGRQEYSYDDYQYNLNNDINSFLHKLIGTARARKDTTTSYTNKIQTAAAQIIRDFNLPAKLLSGKEFSSLAIAVLTDLQKKIQEYYDKNFAEKSSKDRPLKLSEVINDDVIKKIIKDYEDTARSEKATEVQKALINTKSREALTIIHNGIEMFGLRELQNDDIELTKQLEEIEKASKALKHSPKQARELINNIHSLIEDNSNLEYLIPRLHIDKISSNTAHGNMHEYVTSIFSSTKTGGRGLKIRNPVATDILSWNITAHLEQPDLKEVDNIIDKIIQELNKSFELDFEARQSHLKDRRQLNNEINSVIAAFTKKLDEKIKLLDKHANFFIFHESLKLHSSIETGKAKSFNGRSLNILSALDSILSLNDFLPFYSDIEQGRDLYALLALNLSPLAVANAEKIPLEHFFSMFAGMLMFDDVQNMALEAKKILTYTNTHHIHLYKLNRIYMPASLILLSVAENVNKCVDICLQDHAAYATISTGNATKTINTWLEHRAWPKYDTKTKKKDDYTYHQSDWPEVASRVASFTKVRITFLASFLQWITKLSES